MSELTQIFRELVDIGFSMFPGRTFKLKSNFDLIFLKFKFNFLSVIFGHTSPSNKFPSDRNRQKVY